MDFAPHHTERQHNQHNQHTNVDKKFCLHTAHTESLNPTLSRSMLSLDVIYNLFHFILFHFVLCVRLREMLSLVTRLLREAHLMGCLFVSTFQIENTSKFNTMLFYAFSAVHNKRALYVCVRVRVRVEWGNLESLLSVCIYFILHTEWSTLIFVLLSLECEGKGKFAKLTNTAMK